MDINDYDRFLDDLIKSNNIKYQNINQYHHILIEILSYHPLVIDGIKTNPNAWYPFLDEAIEICEYCKDKPGLINNNFLNIVDSTVELPTDFSYQIKSIIMPEIAINDFEKYIRVLSSLIKYGIHYIERIDAFGVVHKNNNFGNSKINDLFKYLNDYRKNNNLSIYIISNEASILALIYAYILFNNLDNYELIGNYLSDKDYYLERLKLLGLNYNDNLHYLYTNNDLITLFNYMEGIFKKNKELIK